MDFFFIWLGAFLLCWSPGLLLGRLARLRSHPDWLVLLAIQLGIGMAFWPVLLLWTSTLGWRWTPALAQGVAILVGVGGIVALMAAPRARWQQRQHRLRRQGLWLTFFACIFTLTAVLRILHVRGLALPPWVDPVHHTMIVQLLVTQGKVPTTFAPIIPDSVFNYHWGYHALVAWLAWLLRAPDAFALADIVLVVGQWLNALTALMLYAGARVLFASRRAGLLAAALVGTVSWLPAYYLTWGRYTHLTGLLLLIPLVVLLWRLRARPTAGDWLLSTLLIAGLALVHVRVAYLGALLLALPGGWDLVRGRWRTPLWWAGAALAAVILTLPWWIALLQSSWVRQFLAVNNDHAAFWASYNEVDWGLVWAPRNAWLIGITTVGLSALLGWHDADLASRLLGAAWLLLVITSVGWVFVRRRCRPPTRRTWGGWLLLVLWVALAAMLMQLDRVGLPPIRIAQLNAGIITLFVPLCLAAAGLLAWASGVWAPPRLALFVSGGLALALAIWGASGMRTVINAATILATPADRAALAWVSQNTPRDAKFAVAVWPWLGNVYAGSDGGYWIPVLTGRASIMPPALYATSISPAELARRNQFLKEWSTVTSLDDPAVRQRLRAEGVTHLYLGARAGPLRAAALLGSPFVTLLYQQDGVSIYALLPE